MRYDGSEKRLGALILALATLVSLQVEALDVEVEGYFETVLITDATVTSVAPAENGVLLLGTADGAIIEISRLGEFRRVLLQPTSPGARRTPTAASALAVSPELDRIYASGHEHPLWFLARSSEEIVSQDWFGTWADFHGLSFDRERNILFALNVWGGPRIFYLPVFPDTGLPGGITRWIWLPIERPTGMAYLPGPGVYLISTEQQLVAMVLGDQINSRNFNANIIGELDVRSLGLSSISDIAHDPERGLLYVADPAQGRVYTLAILPPTAYRRGDVNDDGAMDVSDAVYLLGFLFLGGPPPGCKDAADANSSGTLNVSDPTYLLNHLFLGGPAPPLPGPPGFPCEFEPDPFDTIFGLGCRSYNSCES